MRYKKTGDRVNVSWSAPARAGSHPPEPRGIYCPCRTRDDCCSPPSWSWGLCSLFGSFAWVPRCFSNWYANPFVAEEAPRGIFGIPLNVSIKYANVAISLTNDHGESFIYGYVPIVVAKCGVFLKEKG